MPTDRPPADSGSLPDRVRAALADRSPREVPMFGGISFMIEDRMVAAARRDGDLLLRIDPAQHDRLLALPGAKPAMMGPTRPMGDNWLAVDGVGLEGAGLEAWLAHALEHHAAQTPPR
ncbi:TfoX/Sxy family protein [Mobilicoccus caccae]|nr:TfoX/Sxy family protein [Mobilicoccus caccae]